MIVRCRILCSKSKAERINHWCHLIILIDNLCHFAQKKLISKKVFDWSWNLKRDRFASPDWSSVVLSSKMSSYFDCLLDFDFFKETNKQKNFWKIRKNWSKGPLTKVVPKKCFFSNLTWKRKPMEKMTPKELLERNWYFQNPTPDRYRIYIIVVVNIFSIYVVFQ